MTKIEAEVKGGDNVREDGTEKLNGQGCEPEIE